MRVRGATRCVLTWWSSTRRACRKNARPNGLGWRGAGSSREKLQQGGTDADGDRGRLVELVETPLQLRRE